MLRILTIEVAVRIEFVRKHVADARCGATGASSLVEDRREVARVGIVDMIGASRGCATALAWLHERWVGIDLRTVVGILAAIYALRACGEGQGEGGKQDAE